ncbi:probable WRKY transcription factor 50 [Cornus florida]|uniref:probable WRKY transcription factor 50 n=1 Tax=Cornus florida TaxID=4283 RepID=UPI002899F65C|nr:probable WRKY transcription factor 50 [Cornus florida]
MAGNYPNTNMSDSTFGSLNSPESNNANQSNFEFSDFFELNEWVEEDPAFLIYGYPQTPIRAATEVNDAGGSSSHHEGPGNGDSGNDREREVREKVAFKTKSDVEILEDGYKWRKYGKKMVKNSPNPRNYYRCSAEGCPVKKRIERDREDPKYVITTYEGIHNHQGPSQL